MPSARTKLKWSRTRLKGPEQHDSGIGDMFHSSYNLFFAGMSRSELPVQKHTGSSTGMKLTKVREGFPIDAQAMQCRSVGERRFWKQKVAAYSCEPLLRKIASDIYLLMDFAVLSGIS